MNTEFIVTLKLPALIRIKENSWNGKNFIELENMITCDENTISRRLDAMEDIMGSPALYEGLKEAVPRLAVLREVRAPTFNSGDDLESLYAVRDLQIYIDIVDFLNTLLAEKEWKSELFSGLKKGISELTEDEDFKLLRSSVPEKARTIAQIQSVTIGVNLDCGLHPTDCGIVSVNAQKFTSGSIIEKMLGRGNEFTLASPLTNPANAVNDRRERIGLETAVNSGIFKIFKSSLRSWKPAVKAYTSARTGFLTEYYNELRFLSAAAEFFIGLKELGYPVCRPNVCTVKEKKCTLKGAYNPELALEGVRVKGNDFETDSSGMIYIFDGANGGGKTVFAKTVAISQALFQLGLFVPAESAEISPASQILLHLPSTGRGVSMSRFTEECSKMSELMKEADDNTFIVCDEAFSGTSSFEACAIAEEVLKAMSAKGCRGIFITHIHELAALPQRINPLPVCRSRLDNLTVKVNEETGTRLYTVVRGETSGFSYAGDIADKYGLSFEQLMGEK